MEEGNNPRESEDADVLVVEDEQSLAELYRVWLETEYAVETAYTGDEAGEKLDETVDVVILDRRLPDATGREVLDRIQDRNLDCMVTIVSAVKPVFEIADFPIDDYLTKPVEREELLATVDELLLRATAPISRQELLALHSRRIALEGEMDPGQLEETPEYNELTRKIEVLESELDVAPQSISSRHRPDACPECDLRWNLDVEGTVGFVPMASRVWKCVQCGRVVHKPDPSNRSVTRGR
jgi:DNA-binding response OmpR family regulator